MTEVVINKEMGLTHADFNRDIERVLGAGNYRKTDTGIIAEDGDRRLRIDLSAQTKRTIGLVSLPVTHVTMTFERYGEADIKAFLHIFDRIFRRGGG